MCVCVCKYPQCRGICRKAMRCVLVKVSCRLDTRVCILLGHAMQLERAVVSLQNILCAILCASEGILPSIPVVQSIFSDGFPVACIIVAEFGGLAPDFQLLIWTARKSGPCSCGRIGRISRLAVAFLQVYYRVGVALCCTES